MIPPVENLPSSGLDDIFFVFQMQILVLLEFVQELALCF